MIAANVIEAAHRAGVDRLLYLGSSCIYPRLAPQPIIEDALLTGPLEPTNEAYAIAKIAGIKLCQAYRRQYGRDYISAMPTNLYGPGDNFDLRTSHVLPALIRKAHEASARDLPADDDLGQRHAAPRISPCRRLRRRAGHSCCKVYSARGAVNVGSGEDLTIRELAELVAKVVGFDGPIDADPSKPDGTPRKLMSGARLAALGWRPRIGLEAGIADTYAWYLAHAAEASAAPRESEKSGGGSGARPDLCDELCAGGRRRRPLHRRDRRIPRRKGPCGDGGDDPAALSGWRVAPPYRAFRYSRERRGDMLIERCPLLLRGAWAASGG